MCVAEKLSSNVFVYVTVHSKVLLIDNVDRELTGFVCYQCSLLAHIEVNLVCA